MKKRRFIYWGMNLSAVIVAFGIISALYFYVKEDKNKFFIGLALAVIGLIVFISLYCAYNFADRELKQRWVSYIGLKKSDKVDFKEELAKTVSNYEKDTDLQKNMIPKPNVNGVKHLMDFEVLKTGKIGYGCVVEANVKLFVPSKFVHQVLPAVIAYSYDEHYQSNPLDLKEVAKKFFEQEKNNVLKDEARLFTNHKIDCSLTGDKVVYATVVLVYRKHLPWGGFPSPNLIVPVIAAPESSQSAFILDSKYWADNLVVQFLNDLMPKNRQNTDIPISNEKVDEIFGEFGSNSKDNISDVEK